MTSLNIEAATIADLGQTRCGMELPAAVETESVRLVETSRRPIGLEDPHDGLQTTFLSQLRQGSRQ
jgi:hypothetical protein